MSSLTFADYHDRIREWLKNLSTDRLKSMPVVDYVHQISRYSIVKDEIVGRSLRITVDRVVNTPYPVDYGMSTKLTVDKPMTDSDGKEWTDVIIVDHGFIEFTKGRSYDVIILGRLEMIDCGQADDKYIAIPSAVVKTYQDCDVIDNKWKARIAGNLLLYYGFLHAYKQKYALSADKNKPSIVYKQNAIIVTGLQLY